MFHIQYFTYIYHLSMHVMCHIQSLTNHLSSIWRKEMKLHLPSYLYPPVTSSHFFSNIFPLLNVNISRGRHFVLYITEVTALIKHVITQTRKDVDRRDGTYWKTVSQQFTRGAQRKLWKKFLGPYQKLGPSTSITRNRINTIR
jgi:hypothetical protein